MPFIEVLEYGRYMVAKRTSKPEIHATDQLMTLGDVAVYLKVKERTLYLWAQRGKIPGFKLGHIWRFRREDIDLWIEERKRKTIRTQSSGG